MCFFTADVYIPQNAYLLLRLGSIIVLAIGLAAYVTPWILLGVLPMLIMLGIMKTLSAVTVRQLKRLENIARSPLVSHVNVTAQGLPTIVAFGQENHFYKRF